MRLHHPPRHTDRIGRHSRDQGSMCDERRIARGRFARRVPGPWTELKPSSCDFVDHTTQRVREMGGTDTAHAEKHPGALKVFVGSRAPLLGSDNSPAG
ncbi:hypothetical protein ACFWWB_37450 [Streptomyces sp. NPDC058690]|uniref:hypothetical protein n=1 Tax=Streptomyces sp. NPDC058690 TaxID=3346600 RepID=UPI0036493B42